MIRRLLQTVIVAAVLLYLVTPVHEHGHQMAISLLGGVSHMEYDLTPWGLFAGRVVYDTPIEDPSLYWVAGIAGGLWAAAFLWGVIVLFARWTPTKSDIYVEFSAWMVAYAQLIYGLGIEGVQEAGGPLWLLAFLLPPIAGLAVSLWRYLGWLAKGEV